MIFSKPCDLLSMATHLSSEALIQSIQSAFAHVERQDGITLHQAIAFDSYASPEETEAARLQDTENHWSEIPPETLRNFESALSFMNKSGTCYYLPVFMIAALEGHIDPRIPFFKVIQMMGSLRESAPSRVVATYGFDQNQSGAIAAFLRFVVGEQGERAEGQAELQQVWAWEDYVNNWNA